MSRPAFFTLVAAAALASTSCTGAAEQVRPDSMTAGEAIGESFECSEDTLKGDLSPFTADWSDGNRVALESAMKRGVAVVKMTCDGPEVLKACMVVGDYSYAGVSLKSKLVKMRDQGSAMVNLGGALFSPSFKSALEQGRELMLAYMIAGVETTTVSSVGPLQLKGRCAGATHFVYEAQLGAFTMETAEQGTSATAADVLVGEMSASTDSSKETRTTDGDPDQCEWASESDTDKTEGCSALMRVDLMSISEESASVAAAEPEDKPKATAVRVVGCPDGYTWDGDACQPAESVPFELCDEFDEQGCLEQCKKGSLESCNRFADSLLFDLILEETIHENDLDAFGEAAAQWAGRLPEHIDLLREACDAEMPNACTVLAYDQSFNNFDENGFVELLGRGCVLGDAFACRKIGQEGGLAELTVRRTALGQACNRGVSLACAIWADESANPGLEDRVMDPRFADNAGRACYGGVAGYCPVAAGMYEDAATCAETVMFGESATFGGGFGAEYAAGLCNDYGALTDDDSLEAELLLNAGCDYGHQPSCERLDATYGRMNFDDLDLDDLDLDDL